MKAVIFVGLQGAGKSSFYKERCFDTHLRLSLDMWRSEDAHRNALNAHCYWLLRKQGRDVSETTAALRGVSVSGKNELLFQNGINFNDLASWQKRGSGLSWEEYERVGENPVIGERVVARRRRIRRDLELPVKEAYSAYVRNLMSR